PPSPLLPYTTLFRSGLLGRHVRRSLEEKPFSFGKAHEPRVELPCRGLAHEDLARLGGGLHGHGVRGRRSRKDELPVQVACEEDVDRKSTRLNSSHQI